MIKSVYMRKILSILLAAIIIFALLNVLFYTFLSQQALIEVKTQEMVPKADIVAQNYLEYLHQRRTYTEFSQLASATSLWDAEVLVVDEYKQVVTISSHFFGDDPDQIATESDLTGFEEAITFVIDKNSDYTNTFMRNKMRYLLVGVPVTYNNRVVGCVFLSKPLVEITASLHSLNVSVFLSLAFAVAIMIIPIFIASRQFLKPLSQVRDVALSMAEGDYAVRANQMQKGEVGQLSQTLNYLAERLSMTLSDLILERNRLKQLLDGLSEGIIAINVDGEITHANPSIYRMLHLPDDIRAVESALHTLGLWDDFMTCMETAQSVERTLRRGDTIFGITLSPLTDDDHIAGVVSMFRDVTESERLEQMRKDYVANVSHEMRTPLTALRGLVEPLRDGLVRTEDDRQRYYGIILRETLRLSRLIDDMLELSRLQSGTLALDCHNFSLTLPMRDVFEKYQLIAEETGKQFAMNMPEPVPVVRSNPDRLEQVMAVLLDNAFKYTQSDAEITLSAIYHVDHAEIIVSDNGLGISDEDMPHVFERFYKSDKSRGSVGTGLGLAIAREIMAQLGETIWVTRAPEGGAAFHFTVRFATPS